MVQVEAKLSYQENCDYLPSEITDNIDIDKQEVDINTTVTIVNYDERGLTPKGYKGSVWKNSEFKEYISPGDEESFNPYYNDELQLEIQVTFTHEGNEYKIKSKDINVYFFTIYEDRTNLNPNDFEHNIARNLLLDNEGKVAVKYLPHTSGYFVIEYNETKFFKRKVVEHRIDLKPIPVKVIIKPTKGKPLPIFVHLSEAVDLMASVRDTYGKPPKDGTITFLSYANNYENSNDEINSRFERIIGNPVMLEDGETTQYKPPFLIMNEDKETYPIPSMGDIPNGPVLYDNEWVHYAYNNKDGDSSIKSTIELSFTYGYV